MKAFTLKKYGKTSDLNFEDLEKPQPKSAEVLVKIHTTAINDYDWAQLSGKPFIYRLLFGIFKPRNPILGMELSGTIEALGENASKFEIGDTIYGDISEYAFGSFAEYIAVNEKALFLKPNEMTFTDAAAIPHAGMLAYQALYDIAKIKENQKVLINGAGGGVGSFALQIAKLHKAYVTGIDTGEKLSIMKKLGFDEIIDYKEINFTNETEQYDIILDCKTKHSPLTYLRKLKSNGCYVTVGGDISRLLQILLYALPISIFSKKRVRLLPLKANNGLELFSKLYLNGQIKTIIDGPYPFKKIPWALQRFGDGKHFGKIVISISAD